VPPKGSHLSAETLKKMSIASSNRSAETRKKLSIAHSNPSAETLKKMSIASSNRSAETLKKMSIAHSNPSAETRKKLSIASSKAIQEGRIPTYPKGCGRWFTDRLGRKMYLRSSWELAYAKWLDYQGFTWKYQHKRFLDLDGIHHKLPDFYVDEFDTYVEIKPLYRIQEASDLKRLLELIYHEKLLILTEMDFSEKGEFIESNCMHKLWVR